MVSLCDSGGVVSCVENPLADFGANSPLDHCGTASKDYLKMVDKQIWVWYGFAAAIYLCCNNYVLRQGGHDG